MMIISACLVGAPCRYDGASKPVEKFVELLNAGEVLPVCPEQLGGLKTPRTPAEIVGDRVINKKSEDVTVNFTYGAESVLKICKALDVKIAILKSNSPSCGCGKIYDGSFTGKLTEGNGFTTNLLLKNGIKVYTENADLEQLGLL